MKTYYHKKHAEHPGRGVRKGFDASGGVKCQDCFRLRNENAALKEEVQRLKQKLAFDCKKIVSEGVFGSSTPSSKIPSKKNSTEENRAKRGGARIGHRGRGRKKIHLEEADRVFDYERPEECASCECHLIPWGETNRSVVEMSAIRVEGHVHRLKRARCPKCQRNYASQPASVFPKSFYGNQLLSEALILHYVYGMSIGKLVQLFAGKVSEGGLINAFHRIGDFFSTAERKMIEEYRASEVRHADETGWRTDGKGGYAWVFLTSKLSIYRFGENRSAEVPTSILGKDPLKGVLVVDRWNAYNKMPCEIQYCFAHLQRKIKDLQKDFPEDGEVAAFVKTTLPLFKETMGLRSLKITDDEYYRRAKELRKEIETSMEKSAKHQGILEIQRIFIAKKHRLYHWVNNRAIPSENNAAERETRIPVLARKISFGSQSERGAKTRSSIMSYLNTAKKRLGKRSLEKWLFNILNQLARDPNLDTYSLLPSVSSTD